MKKTVDCTVENIKGYKLNLVRVADNFGWFCDIDGKRYGTWMQVVEGSIKTEEHHKEEYEMMRQSFMETLKALGK